MIGAETLRRRDFKKWNFGIAKLHFVIARLRRDLKWRDFDRLMGLES